MAGLSRFGTLVGGMMLMAMTASAQDGEVARGAVRSVSPWFVYAGEASIETLKPQADLLSSISVCGECPSRFVAQCHDLGIEVYLLRGGSDGAVFATKEARGGLIRDYLSQCEAVGADGVDLNFESLDPEFRDAYSALLREASEAFHAAGKRLSMCVSGIMSTWRTVDMAPTDEPLIDGGWYDPRVVGETCDVVRVMCYDMHSVSAAGVGPVSTVPWAADAMQFWLRHVPRENLVMGLPAYSRDYVFGDSMQIETFYEPRPDVAEGISPRRIWLPYEQIYLYRYVDADQRHHVFFASDADSIRAHLQTAETLGLQAVGFWHAGAVTEDAWPAVRTWVQQGR